VLSCNYKTILPQVGWVFQSLPSLIAPDLDHRLGLEVGLLADQGAEAVGVDHGFHLCNQDGVVEAGSERAMDRKPAWLETSSS
jgi:hypothetical protein